MYRSILLIVLFFFSVVICLGGETKKAEIKFKNKIHKFDTISIDRKAVSYEFVFENKGTAPLVILRSSIACKCTKVKYSKKPILPGEKGSIKVIFNPKGVVAGAYTKNIQIYFNTENKREILTIMGVIK